MTITHQYIRGRVSQPRPNRALVCVLLLLLWSACTVASAAPDVRLVLLGTKGGPAILTPDSLPQSTALLVENDLYLVDAGYGASLRLAQADIPLRRLKGIFITHLHSDHVLDYPAVLMNSWATGLDHSVQVYGPPGMQALTHNVWQAFDVDIGLRVDDEGKPDLREMVDVHEIDEGAVASNADFKVSALRVPHPPFKKGQAFAYRFEIGDRTIVFSGDLNYFPPLSDFAQGADVLVSEVVDRAAVERLAERIGNGSKLADAIISHHVTAPDVGRMAEAAGVKKLVLSHFVPADDPQVTDKTWREGVRQTYDGPVVVGHDGMSIDVDE